MNLKTKRYGRRTVYYRPGTTDEKVLREVIDNRAYRRSSVGFDVKVGERWLDLGANIGAFAIYCRLQGASVECYEPEPTCFTILEKNAPDCKTHRASVSNQKQGTANLWSSIIEGNHYRGTLVKSRGLFSRHAISVPNIHAGNLDGYDGIKMDIEGSEFGILDDGLLPWCNKFCFEYHTSRDRSMDNLKRRIQYLRNLFEVVSYVPELDRLMALGGEQKSFHDRVIYCIGRKKKSPRVTRGS